MNYENSILIIGSSAAGISAAKEIRKVNKQIAIRIVSSDKNMPYYRPYLTEYICDEKIELKSNFYLNKDKWYEENNIELILNETVSEIDKLNKIVKTDKYNEFSYGKLIIASGSKPFVPVENLLDYDNVLAIRSFDDAKNLTNCLKEINDITIVGGGLLGIEAAESFMKIGKTVRILELSKFLLPKQLDNSCSMLLQNTLNEKGIILKLGVHVSSYIPDDGNCIKQIILDSGEIIETGMVIFSIGVRSNKELAKNAGLNTNRGIIVNEKMQTSCMDIFACGDVCEFGNVPALWMPAIKQGKVAGLNAIGLDEKFESVQYPAILNVCSLRIYSVGKIPKETELKNFVIVSKEDIELNKHQKLFFQENILVGAIFFGDMKNSMKALAGINNKLNLSQLENLL